jgi:hypothetical protein
MVLTEELEKANRRARRLKAAEPHAVEARYDDRLSRVFVRLSTGIDIAFVPQDAEGLERATAAELQQIEISPSGFGLHFPALDADLFLPALLEDFLGSRKWMARRLGAEGGRSTSQAKAAAARQNGARGGRPRKAAAAD